MIKFSTTEDRVIKKSNVSLTDRFTENVTEVPKSVTESFTEVTEKERTLLHLLIENPYYKTAELAVKLSVSRQTISRRIRALKDKELIKREGSDTKGFWRRRQKEKHTGER